MAQRLSRSLRFTNALIGPIAMRLGSLIAYEALRYLSGFEPPRAAGAQVVLDLACAVAFAAVPALFPAPSRDAFAFGDTGLSAVLPAPLSVLTMALHECGHWLAARAIGLRARFGVNRRMMLLVFETDLTQLWSVPRRRRYGPLPGGMALDVVLLALLLTGRLLIHMGAWSAAPVVDAVLAVGIYLEPAGLLWQCMVFLHTDFHAVLVNLLGCHNLWRVKTLRPREAFGGLTAEQSAELAGASEADRRAAGWFRWLWLAGFAGVLACFAVFVVPVLVTVLRWTAGQVAAGPLTGGFRYGLLCAAVLLGPYLLAAALAVGERVRRT
ncbi:hypothetical protein L6E12_05460 [Actinokineospora sp. PR83]|uniref:hypothetical protein n=1 Tax=Actinokineospora sp. PR83 TaxID=2884908 RepID=UPI0027E1176E|nr:hypothetical protein [Actinokineospora sp. PR83]MCG8915237.1 hypothetical protein [Actinokineospora sp. PR83]